MCMENEISLNISNGYSYKNEYPISSGHNAFDAYRFFRTYVFAFSTAKTNLFIDYFEQTVINS